MYGRLRSPLAVDWHLTVTASLRGIPFNQDTAKDVLDYKSPQPSLQPVVRRGDRPRSSPSERRQHGPNQHEVGVARVIREVDSPNARGRASPPSVARARKGG